MNKHKYIPEILQKNMLPLARSMLDAAATTQKWSLLREQNKDNLEDFLEFEFFAFIDYLSLYFNTGKDGYLDLYIGEKLKQLYDPKLDFNGNKENKINVSEKDKELFKEISSKIPNTIERKEFLDTIESIYTIVLGDVKKKLHVLFVGDCLYLDVVSFLTAPLHRANISIFPSFATSKNIVELQETIKSKAYENFDLVFFSPFTYEFNLEYNQIYKYKDVNYFKKSFKDLIESAWQSTKSTIDLLSVLFECPIYVHNSSAVFLEESFFKRTIKRFLSAPKRNFAKNFVNDKLNAYIQDKNSKTYKHIFLLDETSLVKKFGENTLGQFIYKTRLQHPAKLGREIAKKYFDILYIYANLINKKLIVFDLDNTLWNGVIGEGPVTNFTDKQKILLDLKKKGVVLAICSKNDPKNVHWKGALLNEDDFVARAISWNPKIYGMKEIQDELNLKFKDFIFLDDSPEELEMISSTFPEIICFNATDSHKWNLLRHWSQMIDESLEMDRTKMYQQREERKQFLKKDNHSIDVINKNLFNDLNLELTIRQASESDLKRVAELINRTNQFNLLGSRISFKELQNYHLSDAYKVFIGDLKDRFGSMGTVSILIVHEEKTVLNILVFVLSCRVFGYGIEKAMLNHVKSLSVSKNLPLQGRYLPNERNQPCENVYKDNSFDFSDGNWYWKNDLVDQNEKWLKVIANNFNKK